MDEEKLTKKEKRELAKEKKQEEREKRKMGNNLKKFFVWFVTAGLIIFVGVKGYNWVTTPSPQVNGTSTVEISDSDWIRGNVEAPVTLVEFGDFECPACANYYPLVRQVEEAFPDNLRVVYKHYPLVTIHKNAFAASKASEAAGMQGKFFEMHDVLYENHDEWVEMRDPKPKFEEYAGNIGLDMEKYKSDFDSKELEDNINEDLATGRGIGINSTPTFYLNGHKIQPRSFDQFKSFVEDELKSVNQ